jgi:hypothetical protein
MLLHLISERKERFMPFKNPHPLYSTWINMRSRCSNPTLPNYHLYGGRGIKVCDEWNDFHRFIADMGPKPTPLHSIERKDNDGHYSAELRKENKTEINLELDGLLLMGNGTLLLIFPKNMD